jgi:hypothetical protein
MRDIEIDKPGWLVWTHCPESPMARRGCPIFGKRMALNGKATSYVCLVLPWLWIGVVHYVRRG